jgi:hypothetical protein
VKLFGLYIETTTARQAALDYVYNRGFSTGVERGKETERLRKLNAHNDSNRNIKSEAFRAGLTAAAAYISTCSLAELNEPATLQDRILAMENRRA